MVVVAVVAAVDVVVVVVAVVAVDDVLKQGLPVKAVELALTYLPYSNPNVGGSS